MDTILRRALSRPKKQCVLLLPLALGVTALLVASLQTVAQYTKAAALYGQG